MSKVRVFLQSYHPIVHSLIFGTVIARAADSMSLPFLAIYLSRQTDLSPVMIGITIGLGPVAGTIGGFIGGTLSDRFGRKKVMLSALYTWGLVFLGFAFANSSWMFMMLAMVNGLCRSFFEPVSQALMADLTEPERRLRVFSMRYTAINVGVSVGPLLGAVLGLTAGWLPFFVTGTIYLVYAATLHTLLNRFGIREIEGQQKEPVTFLSAWSVLAQDVAFRYFIVGGIFTSLAYAQMTVTLSQYVEQSFTDGVKLFAWLMSVNAIAVIVFQMPLAKWAEKRTPLIAIAVGNCLYALGDVGFAYSNGWSTMIASMVIFTLGEILTFPAGSVFIDRLAPEGMRGTYFGAKTFTNVGHFLGPWVGGILLVAYGGSAMFMIFAAVILFSTVFYWAGQRRHEIRTGKTMHMAKSL
ncbi:MDR family MFS transporter [Effusibacillus consociatus]|uniref:MDR family MFS transporter n=1 Tax=Effusibacillus consociatus TaxID=1117041 RepID=A0ABV9PYY1_9BACL